MCESMHSAFRKLWACLVPERGAGVDEPLSSKEAWAVWEGGCRGGAGGGVLYPPRGRCLPLILRYLHLKGDSIPSYKIMCNESKAKFKRWFVCFS